MTDDMSMFDSEAPIEEPQAQSKPTIKQKRGSSSTKPKFSEIGSPSARIEAAKASGRGTSIGNEKHKQLTFRVPWEWVEELETWAAKIGVSKEEMKRYVVRRGLDALKAGERPQVEPVTVRNTISYG